MYNRSEGGNGVFHSPLKTERSVFHCRAGVKKQGFPHSGHCTESGGKSAICSAYVRKHDFLKRKKSAKRRFCTIFSTTCGKLSDSGVFHRLFLFSTEWERKENRMTQSARRAFFLCPQEDSRGQRKSAAYRKIPRITSASPRSCGRKWHRSAAATTVSTTVRIIIGAPEPFFS